MKITEENLKKLRYVEKNDRWYSGNMGYVIIDSCKICGDPYLTPAHKKGDFCSYECLGVYNRESLIGERFGRLLVIESTERKYRRSPIWKCRCDCGNIIDIHSHNLKNGNTQSCGCLRKELHDKRINKNHPSWKGGYSSLDIPLYDTYAPQIEYVEEVRRNKEDENILEVKCAYCGKWYVPTINKVYNRINALNGNGTGENRFYCCNECKKECPIFNQKKFPKGYKKASSREVQPELRQLVFERDNYTCQKCSSTQSLHCHHIEGIRWEPLESSDMDKCITYCKTCHKEVHKIEECRMVDMKCKEV